MIHLLAIEGSDKHVLINLRGETENRPASRIHSIVELDNKLNPKSYITSTPSTVSGENLVAISDGEYIEIFAIQNEGPKFVFDVSKATTEPTAFFVNVTNGSKMTSLAETSLDIMRYNSNATISRKVGSNATNVTEKVTAYPLE